MNNYKITNLRTSKSYFLNEEEKTKFLKKNKFKNYDIINLSKLKRIKINKILDTIIFVSFFAAAILTTILIIEIYY